MYKRRIFEISLKRVTLDFAGGKTGKSRHICTASLIWPRPGISERVSAVSIDSVGRSLDWEPDGWESGILFKETVQGAFALRVGISEPVKDGQVERFISFLESSTMKALGSELSGIVSNPVATGLIESPFLYASKGKSKKDAPRLVGAGSIDMSAGLSLKAGGKKTVRIPLEAPAALYTTSGRRKHGSVSSSRKIAKKAGASNGEIVLNVRAYN